MVGPNPTFLRYIEQVLPSLGETDVLLSTVGGLFPGVAATGQEPLEVAASRATRAWSGCWPRRSPTASRSPTPTSWSRSAGCACAWTRRPAPRPAAGPGRRHPHNEARSVFRRELVLALADQMVAALTRDLPEVDLPDDDQLVDLFPDERLLDPDLDEIRAELAAHPAVRSALDRLWPRLTAQQLVGDLLASPERLAAAGGHLDPAELALLHRPAAADGPGWTPADVPLLDEAAVLLGDDGARARRAEARQAEQDRAELYAREVLANTSIGDAARYTPDTSAIDPRCWPAAGASGGRRRRCRPGPPGPDLGVRPRDRGRGPGAVADGLAHGDAAQPQPLDDRGRRRRPDRRPLGSRLVGPGPGPAGRAAGGSRS